MSKLDVSFLNLLGIVKQSLEPYSVTGIIGSSH